MIKCRSKLLNLKFDLAKQKELRCWSRLPIGAISEGTPPQSPASFAVRFGCGGVRLYAPQEKKPLPII